MATGWGSWRAEAERVDREAFLARFGHPFLVICDEVAEGATALVETVRLTALAPAQPPAVFGDDARVLPVVKSEAAVDVFPDMITVGRAPNNDLVLPDDRVSSFHAYFTRRAAGWELRDGASSNGTYLRGQRVEGPARLGDDAWLSFAGIQCRFLLPAAMYDALTRPP